MEKTSEEKCGICGGLLVEEFVRELISVLPLVDGNVSKGHRCERCGSMTYKVKPISVSKS